MKLFKIVFAALAAVPSVAMANQVHGITDEIYEWGNGVNELIDSSLEPLFDDEKGDYALVGQVALGTLETALVYHKWGLPQGFSRIEKLASSMMKNSHQGNLLRAVQHKSGQTLRVVSRTTQGLTRLYVILDIGSRVYVWTKLDNDPAFTPFYSIATKATGSIASIVGRGEAIDKILDYIDGEFSSFESNLNMKDGKQ